jgi:hypothetical protein
MLPNLYRRLVKLEDVAIKTSHFKIHWFEGPLGITAETSFGRCHISKKHKDLTVYSPMGTVNMHSNIKDIVKLKQKVEELHTSIIMKSQMYIHNQIKVK